MKTKQHPHYSTRVSYIIQPTDWSLWTYGTELTRKYELIELNYFETENITVTENALILPHV